ncbi:hypothetical protein RCL1_000751 [Eukaryota sp. TZLM3-RCL]
MSSKRKKRSAVFLLVVKQLLAMFNHYSFNSLGTCLAVATDSGFAIYSIDTNQWKDPIISRSIPTGIRIVELLFHSSSVFLVGNHPSDSNSSSLSQWAPQNLRIWSDSQRYIVGDLKLSSPILAVRVNAAIIAVSTIDSVWTYRLSDLSPLDSIKTTANPTGALAMSPISDPEHTSVLVSLGQTEGDITGYWIRNGEQIASHTCSAHRHAVTHIVMSSDGAFCATSSTKGTMVRVYSLDEKQGFTLVKSLRRGLTNANITSMCFAQDSSILAVASNHGTIHFFDLRCLEESKAGEPCRAACHYAIEDVKPIICFGPNDEKLGVAMSSGTFFQLNVSKLNSQTDFISVRPSSLTGSFLITNSGKVE